MNSQVFKIVTAENQIPSSESTAKTLNEKVKFVQN